MSSNLSFEELIKATVRDAVESSFTIEKAELLAFSRFENTLVSVNTVAEILNVHPDTVRSYVKYKLLNPVSRDTDRSPYKFKLTDVLKFRK